MSECSNVNQSSLCHDKASMHIDSQQCEYKAPAWPLMSHNSGVCPVRLSTITMDPDLKKSVMGQDKEKEVSSSIIQMARHFFALLMDQNNGPPPDLQIGLDLVALPH